MKIKLLTMSAVLLFTCAVRAQQAVPNAQPTPPDNKDVVRISTALIQLDVTVTDNHGRIVKDIRPEEIEVYENGVKQNITHFKFVTDERETSETTADKKVHPVAGPLPTFGNIRPEQVRRTIALVVDDLSLSWDSILGVQRALRKFVDEQMQEGDLVAIIRTGSGIGALQGFTTDKRQLHAAIEKVSWNPFGAGRVSATAPLEAKVGLEPPVPTPTPADGDRTQDGRQREFEEFRENVFAAGTLGTINYIIRGMQGIPGRKSVLLMSNGFRMLEKDAGGSTSSGRVIDSMQKLIDRANRSSVVIYTMDARGLLTGQFTAIDNADGRQQEDVLQEFTTRSSALLESKEGLKYLANQTGGIAILNSNDLATGIRRILDDQSYYLLGYEPDADTFDAKTRRFNQLVVKVTRPNTRVRYRSGFFGVTDEKVVHEKESGNQRLINALSSPFAVSDISLRLNALFGSDRKQGAYVRSLMHIDARGIAFADRPDGGKEAVFDVVAIAVEDSGAVVDQVSKTFTMNITRAVYEIFLKTGFVYDFTFPAKKPGAYQFRVALHDRGSDKVGSVTQFIAVPDLKKDRLTLSGVILEDVAARQWQLHQSGQATADDQGSSPMIDTSLREFKRGTILNYAFAVYNAKLDTDRHANLSLKIRLLHDGKSIVEGPLQKIPPGEQLDPNTIDVGTSFSLGSRMDVGDYVLEITVVDNLAKDKQRIATQYAQFAVVE